MQFDNPSTLFAHPHPSEGEEVIRQGRDLKQNLTAFAKFSGGCLGFFVLSSSFLILALFSLSKQDDLYGFFSLLLLVCGLQAVPFFCSALWWQNNSLRPFLLGLLVGWILLDIGYPVLAALSFFYQCRTGQCPQGLTG